MNAAVIVLLVFLGACIWMALDVRDTRRVRVFWLMLAALAYSPVCGAVLNWENALLPYKFDGSLYRVDSAIGLSAFAIARVLREGGARLVLSIAYCLILPMMVFWCAVQLHRRWEGPSILWAYAVEMLCGPCLYALVPACGPRYASQRFPFSSLSFSDGALNGVPNCMPSLHVTTALLLFFFAKGKIWKALAIVFLTATALATLVTGEHYVIDLIVAVPFACFVFFSAQRRFGLAAIHLGIVLMWMLSIRLETLWLLAHPWWLRMGVLLTFAVAAIKVPIQKELEYSPDSVRAQDLVTGTC